jgi:hypothetical protein
MEVKKMSEKLRIFEERILEFKKDMLNGWRPLGDGRFGWWGSLCTDCKKQSCDGCSPLLMLVIRKVYKRGQMLVLYGLGIFPLADGDHEVQKYLTEINIPLPKFLEGENDE